MKKKGSNKMSILSPFIIAQIKAEQHAASKDALSLKFPLKKFMPVSVTIFCPKIKLYTHICIQAIIFHLNVSSQTSCELQLRLSVVHE